MSQLILHYSGTQVVDVTLTGDYKTDRELIFGKDSWIKDKPLIKAIYLMLGYTKFKYWITPDEEFTDIIVETYPKPRYAWAFAWISALIARVTNYFQVLQGVREEDKNTVLNDINFIISTLLSYKLPQYDINFIINFDDINSSYTVILDIYELY